MRLSRGLFVATLCIVAAFVCLWTGRLFVRHVSGDVPFRTECTNGTGTFSSTDETARDEYRSCLEERAKLFMDRDYAEARDISKAFLTLLTAVFVASITFSEKIVNVSTSGWWPRALIICCWVLLLVAIAACGAALALMMQAAGYASYYPKQNYWMFEADAEQLYLCSGLAFGAALVCMLVAGIVALVDGRLGSVRGSGRIGV